MLYMVSFGLGRPVDRGDRLVPGPGYMRGRADLRLAHETPQHEATRSVYELRTVSCDRDAEAAEYDLLLLGQFKDFPAAITCRSVWVTAGAAPHWESAHGQGL